MAKTIEFDSTIRTMRPGLLRFITRLVGDADAEDVVQIVLSKAASALPEFRGDASLRTWLFRITKNAAHDWMRRRKTLPRESLETTSDENIAVGSDDTAQDRLLEKRQMSLCVDEVLRSLPESYQVVLALSDCEELSDRETAAILGVTVGTAKIRLHRARAKMKEELERDCSFYRDTKNTLCCDRKQNIKKSAYPFNRGSRLQGKRRKKGGDTEPVEGESAMSTNETLPKKQKHLIGVGAAMAAGCHPCTSSYAAAAKSEGACDRGVRFAIEMGLKGRESSTSASIAFSDTTFATPDLDASFRSERALLEKLIDVAAAVGGNSSVRVEPSMKAARKVGATDEQIRTAVQIARTVRRGAESETEAAVARALGDEPTSGCCDSASPEALPRGLTTNVVSDMADGDVPSASGCDCGSGPNNEFETVRIEKTKIGCSLCEDYANKQSHKPLVIMSCEGACLRGEISRQAANYLCFDLAPEKTVRLCLGGAFTKDAGQRSLVRNANKIVALEGCAIRCASRMMRGHFPDLAVEVIVTDTLCEFDQTLFAVNELPADEIQVLGKSAAAQVLKKMTSGSKPPSCI